MATNLYGYVNGEAVESRDEFVYRCRHFGAITNDRVLMEFASKVSWNWHYGAQCGTFEGYYLGDYALDEPKRSLTDREYKRLKELQEEARAKAKEAEEARQWRKIETIYWADNSVEETWEDKDGNRKQVMVVQPHGDVC